MEAVYLTHPRIREPITFDFLDLLLDDTIAAGEISVPEEANALIGGYNRRLTGKRRYEWLLRLAAVYPVIGRPGEMAAPEEEETDGYLTDCYVAARYTEVLKQRGMFETVLSALINEAQNAPDKDDKLRLLEEMIGRGQQYEHLYDATAPVLLYYGPTWCYNALNMIINGMKDALTSQGIPVETYDEQTEGLSGLSRFVGKRFQAVFDVQSWLFSVRRKDDGSYLHDRITGPKYNMILDHPVWLKEHLSHMPARSYVLTHDPHYCVYVRQHFPGIKAAFLFPPAGLVSGSRKEILEKERPIDLVFVGTYGDYRNRCKEIRASKRAVRLLACRFLLRLKRTPELPAETAFEKTLQELGVEAELFDYRSVVQLVMYYYREKTMRTLLEAGLHVEVYGDTWRSAPFFGHPCLHLHPDVDLGESLPIYQGAKISLNIMAWHKGGFTERMANSMLNGAVVLTDETDFPGLQDKEQLRMFSLERLSALPEIVRELLSDEEALKGLRERAYDYAIAEHTWEKRAQQLLGLIDREEE